MKIRNFTAVTVWLIYLNRNDSVKKLMQFAGKTLTSDIKLQYFIALKLFQNLRCQLHLLLI